MRTALIYLIYDKGLRLSNNARKTATIGQMINLVSVNAQSFNEFAHHLHIVWSCFITVAVSFVLLANILNVIASLGGVIAMAIFIPLNSYLMNKSKMKQAKRLKYQDSRIKNISEVLNGIKIIKFYSWEISFEKIISKIRTIELAILRKISFLNIGQSFGWVASPFLVKKETHLKN